MFRKPFILRSYQTVARSLNNKTVRRAMLSALIAGSSFAAVPSARASDVDNRGGISILVHEFAVDADNGEPSEPDITSKVEPEKVEIADSPGTHDSAPVAVAVEEKPLADEVAAEEVADGEVADGEVADGEVADVCEVTVTEAAEVNVSDPVDVVENEADDTSSVVAVVEKDATSQWEHSIAAAMAASVAKLGISIEQVLEPFAMVGPIANQPPTVEQIEDSVTLNRWWIDTETVAVAKKEVVEAMTDVESEIAIDAKDEVSDQAEEMVESVAVAAVEVVEQAEPEEEVELEAADQFEVAVKVEVANQDSTIQAAIEELAAEEPLDVQENAFEPGDEKLVGSSPVIVTIQEAYLPYDLAQRDLEMNWLPLTTVVPLTEKNYVLQPETSTVEVAATKIDAVEVVTEETEVAEISQLAESVAGDVKMSPECLLDSLAHQTSQLAARAEAVDFTIARLGQSFGEWVASLSQPRIDIVKEAAPVEIASVVVGSAVVCPSECELNAEQETVEPTEEVAVAMMEVDGESIPAPVADPAADAIDQIAMMEVDGQTIPAPVADPVPNGEAQEQIASSENQEDLALVEPVTNEALTEAVQPAAEASIEELIATISQWQRQAIESILDSEAPAQEAPAAAIAEKVEASNETMLR